MRKVIGGMVIGAAGILLGVHWFSWKLVLVILIILWGNNLERVGAEQVRMARNAWDDLIKPKQ